MLFLCYFFVLYTCVPLSRIDSIVFMYTWANFWGRQPHACVHHSAVNLGWLGKLVLFLTLTMIFCQTYLPLYTWPSLVAYRRRLNI